jgi:hypothetical protein
MYASVLDRLGAMSASHPVRFWNFIPGIHNPVGKGLDRYMAFNAGRFAALRADRELSAGACSASTAAGGAIPTATGVGYHGEDLVIHCLSLTVPGRPIENPRQVPAYRYSDRYGPLPPCFARATAAMFPGESHEFLLVGGTASIVGEDSCHAGVLASQFHETCQNLRTLVAAWDGAAADSVWADRFRDLRVYVPPNRTCLDDAAALVRSVFTGNTRIEFLPAQLCREELLIEIEGVVVGVRDRVPVSAIIGAP